ncbi:MAG: 50S ribosomal protein L11 methyltransferase [Rikenellaceae bacterium]
MDYVELNIPVESVEMGEILTAELAEFPFESFQTEGGYLKAYIPQDRLSDCMGEVNDVVKGYGIEGFRYISIETQNWNAEWESNFECVEVGGDKLLIRAPFHDADPRFGMEVVIMPKMSFGTGHHATTHLMAESIIDLGVDGMEGLDMGSGTGVLAIVAAKCGASRVDAIDIDEWAFENCCENCEVNGVADRITPKLGNASLITENSYDFICANINRNILLADMPTYRKALKSGGVLLISGFLEADIEILTSRATELGMSAEGEKVRDGWVVLKFKA